MIDKAGRLFAQVNMDEAKRALEAARKEETVVQSALKVLLNKKDTDENIVFGEKRRSLPFPGEKHPNGDNTCF